MRERVGVLVRVAPEARHEPGKASAPDPRGRKHPADAPPPATTPSRTSTRSKTTPGEGPPKPAIIDPAPGIGFSVPVGASLRRLVSVRGLHRVRRLGLVRRGGLFLLGLGEDTDTDTQGTAR